MDKITKALRKFSGEDFDQIKNLLQKLESNDFQSLDLKKLKGSKNIYRIKKGKLRIIFKIDGEKKLLLKIERRNESTYREF